MVGVCSHKTALADCQCQYDESFSPVPCTICDKRILDISGLEVRLKCPHCHKIIRIPFILLIRQN